MSMAISSTWLDHAPHRPPRTEGLDPALADAPGLYVTQVQRYEASASLPSLEAVKKIAQIVRVATDFVNFEESELAPDANLALQFRAIATMPEPQQAVIRQLLEGMIIKYEAERWSSRIK